MRFGRRVSFSAGVAEVPSGVVPFSAVGVPSPAAESRRRRFGVGPSAAGSSSRSSSPSASPTTVRSMPPAGCMTRRVFDVSTRLTRNVRSLVHSTASSSGAPLKLRDSSPDWIFSSRSGGSSRSSTSLASKSRAYTKFAGSPGLSPRTRVNQSSSEPIARGRGRRGGGRSDARYGVPTLAILNLRDEKNRLDSGFLFSIWRAARL